MMFRRSVAVLFGIAILCSWGVAAEDEKEAVEEKPAPQASEEKADDSEAKQAESKEEKADDAAGQDKPEEKAEEKPEADKAEEAAGSQEGPQPKVVAQALKNPSGLVVHDNGHVFVATAKAVYRLYRNDQNRLTLGVEVNQYPEDVYGKGPKYEIGPLGLALLGGDQLVVGDGSRPDGEELVRFYKITEEPPAEPTAESDAAHTLGPIEAGEQSAKGEGNFYALAVLDDAIYLTSNGDDTKGWVNRIPLENGEPQKLETYLPTKELVNVDAPVGITVNKEGQLVVGQMGEINIPADSLLTTYDPESKELLKKWETGLNDIAGLAYSPTSGKLYAVDFSWMAPKDGGLFELAVDGDNVEAKKVLSLDRPSTLAFDKEGNLYVSIFGKLKDEERQKDGQIVRIPKEMLE